MTVEIEEVPEEVAHSGEPEEFFFDGGHSATKAITGQTRTHFPSRFVEITRAQYSSALDRAGKLQPSDAVDRRKDFLLMGKGKNATGYVMGIAASSYVSAPPVNGRARYHRASYGVQFASAVGRAYAGKADLLKRVGMRVTATHASRDAEYLDDLIGTLVGKWDFEIAGERFQFEVFAVDTLDEPLGGYYNLAIVFDGKKFVYPFMDKSISMLDSGGGTSASIHIIKGGTIDFTAAKSTNSGVNEAIERLRDSIKAKHGKAFKLINELPFDALAKAIQTGIFTLAGRDIDVKDLVAQALAPTINDIMGLWVNALKAGAESDMVGLTGGGMKLIGPQTIAALDFPSDKIFYAKFDRNPKTQAMTPSELLRFANVEGAQKFKLAIAAELRKNA